MRVSSAVCPATQQLALRTGLEENASEPRLCAQPQRTCWVDEQQPTVSGPAEEGSQHIGLLVAGLWSPGQERLQVDGGDFSPANQPAVAGEVTGEIAQDPQFRFDGDVADRPGAHSPAAFSAVQLELVE